MNKSRLVVLAGLLILASTAFAQKYNITRTVLDNGLEVAVIHNPTVPLVTVEVDVKNGAYTEPPEYDGLSHLYEHMFFKANQTIPNQEAYMDRLNELGAVWNGTTSEERVNYYFTVPKDSLKPALVFMYDAITGPLFLEEELVNERPVVTGEYDRAEANPYFHLFRAVDRKVWWKYYSYKNVIGDREVILTTDQAKMQTIQGRFYHPNNSLLILAGDVEPEEGFAMAESIFSNWERGPDPFEQFPVPEHPPIQQTETVVVEKPVNVVTIMVRWHGPSVSKDEDATYAADVLSFILGQETSKFRKNLVESGLAYTANFGYYTLNYTGPITLFVQTSVENYEACKAAVFEELENMAGEDYFTDQQLANAKTILAIDEQYAREQPSNFVHTLGFWWAVAGPDYYLNYIDNLNKVSREEIARYLTTYVIDQPYVMGILASAEQRAQLGL